ncbi:MAG: DNA-directed RNA polymerase subunit alpha C-terminal domain-containing protein [Patescibacteria group bacterium]
MSENRIEQLARDFEVWELVGALKLKLGFPACSDGPSEMDARDSLRSELGLGTRALNCLVRCGIRSVYDLGRCSAYELQRIRNCGNKTLAEISDSLARKGMSLYSEDRNDRIPALVAAGHAIAPSANIEGQFLIRGRTSWWTRYPKPYIVAFRSVAHLLKIFGVENPIVELDRRGFTP